MVCVFSLRCTSPHVSSRNDLFWCFHSNSVSWGASVSSGQTVTHSYECCLALGSSESCSCAASLLQSSPWGGIVQDHYHCCGTSSQSDNIRCCGKPYKSQLTIPSNTWTSLGMSRLPAADSQLPRRQLPRRQHCWVTLWDNTLGKSLRSSVVVC